MLPLSLPWTDPNAALSAELDSTRTVDLIPNGSNIAVTKENRLTYLYPISYYRLSKQIKQQSDAFFEGLSQMIDQKWFRCEFISAICFSRRR